MYCKEFIAAHKNSPDEIPKRISVGSAVIAENGALKTIATYYEGHLNLDNFANWGGEHLMGFTGPETRIITRELRPTHFIDNEPNPADTQSHSSDHVLQESVPVLVG